MTSTPTVAAREYLRVSLDSSGRERSIAEQHADNTSAAAEAGWSLGAPYRDKGSASRHARNGRDGFDALMADLGAGRFDAELLVLWESSRGSRRVGEWVALVEACERRRVRIAVTTHGPRTYDPANPRDRRNLLEDAVDSEYESAKLSQRVRRAAAANAAAGKPHGPAPYGYRRTYDPRTRRLVGQEPDPVEAPVVLELFERLNAGHSLNAISRDFCARGLVGRRGRPLRPATLRSMAGSASYAGIRTHAPGTSRRAPLESSNIVEASWPAIVPVELFYAVRARLSDPSRLTHRPGRGVNLLSRIALCDACDSGLAVTYRFAGRRDYQCRAAGHVRLDADALDVLAVEMMLRFLARPDNVERLVADDDHDQAVAEARGRLAAIRAELDDLADQVGAGELSATLAARAEPQVRERLARAEHALTELVTPPTLRGLIEPGDDVAARWEQAPMSARREIARLLLSPAVLGELRVTRSPRPGVAVPVAERVVWRR
jgi:site-specific DNA recombinase